MSQSKFYCVGCGRNFENGETQYQSSLYLASNYCLLCEACSKWEEHVISTQGTNSLPGLLQSYNMMLKVAD